MMKNKIDYDQLAEICNDLSSKQIDFVNVFCENHIDFIIQNSVKILEDKTENKEAVFYAFRVKANKNRYIQARICSIRIKDLNNNKPSWFIEEGNMTSVISKPDELCRFPTLTTPFYRDVYSFVRDIITEIKKNND